MGCRFLLQGDHPDPGIKPVSLVSPALLGGFFTTVPLGKLLSTEETNVRKIILVYFFFFFDADHFQKSFLNESVIILLLFYVLNFWPPDL